MEAAVDSRLGGGARLRHAAGALGIYGQEQLGAQGNGAGTDFSGGGTLRSGNGESGVVTR